MLLFSGVQELARTNKYCATIIRVIKPTTKNGPRRADYIEMLYMLDRASNKERSTIRSESCLSSTLKGEVKR